MCRVIERSLLSPTLIRVGDTEVEVTDEVPYIDFLGGETPYRVQKKKYPNPVRRFGHDRTA